MLADPLLSFVKRGGQTSLGVPQLTHSGSELLMMSCYEGLSD